MSGAGYSILLWDRARSHGRLLLAQLRARAGAHAADVIDADHGRARAILIGMHDADDADALAARNAGEAAAMHRVAHAVVAGDRVAAADRVDDGAGHGT